MSLGRSEAAIARPCGMERCRRCRASAPDSVSDDGETRAPDMWANLEPE